MKDLITVLNEIIPISIAELSVLGGMLILVGVTFKLISAIQLVFNTLKMIVSERALPTMIAIVVISVPIGVAGSDYIFISNSQYPMLQADFILLASHIFSVELIAAFLISKRPRIKKYSIFIFILIVITLFIEDNYNYLYTLFSFLAFLTAVLQYRRSDSVERKEYWGALYLRIILATSFVLSALILSNIIINLNSVKLSNAILTITVLAIIQYEFHNKMMGEINYL